MDGEVARASTTEGLPVSPSLGPTLQAAQVPPHATVIDWRVMFVSLTAIVLAIIAALVAIVLTHLIGFFTNVFFYGRISIEPVTPAANNLGIWVVFIPVMGGLIVGLMARFGSKGIRGHGIPEAMEQVLTNQSRIPARMTWLKPLSAAVSIGTGGPFGAEGPIIATGGSFGSLIGQILSTSAAERKTLLAAGAAAGMAATFGSPVSAVLLAMELLLFEFRPRSFIPVAMASATAAGVRAAIVGAQPAFAMPTLTAPSGEALIIYILIGAIAGILSVGVTRVVYAIEDAFARLPVHWMWWPAIGAAVVGIVGYFSPRTLGVGYDNITDIISSHLALSAVLMLCLLKFVSWSISLGSGTSGGTLAPLLTIGAGCGAGLGFAAAHAFPNAAVDVRLAALVGMAALFAGASRAVLASALFAFETTLQPISLLPLLGGCSASFFVSCLLMRQSIMTEKIARRGVRVPSEYAADALEQVIVRNAASKNVITLNAEDTLENVRTWLAGGGKGTSHQGFPVVDSTGLLLGVVTRRDLLPGLGATAKPPSTRIRELLRRPPVIVYADCTLREAADHMVRHGVGRLPVIEREHPNRVVGIITRSDLLSAHRQRVEELKPAEPSLKLRALKPQRATAQS